MKGREAGKVFHCRERPLGLETKDRENDEDSFSWCSGRTIGQDQRRTNKKSMRATNRSKMETAAAMKTAETPGNFAGTRTDMVVRKEDEPSVKRKGITEMGRAQTQGGQTAGEDPRTAATEHARLLIFSSSTPTRLISITSCPSSKIKIQKILIFRFADERMCALRSLTPHTPLTSTTRRQSWCHLLTRSHAELALIVREPHSKWVFHSEMA